MHRQMSAGALAVDFFFVLSGFLVAKSFQQSRTAGDFVRKRLLRIYPGFIVAIAFCVFVIGPLGADNLHAYFHTPRAYKLFDVLLLRPEGSVPGVFTHLPNPGIMNAPLWTIRWELLCYTGILALGSTGILSRRIWMLAIALIAYAVYNDGHEINRNLLYWGSIVEAPRLATFFLSGSIFYLYRDMIPHTRAMLALGVIALAATCFAGLSWTLPIFGTYALFYLAFSRTLRLHHFGKFGDFSYGLYLFAYPIQQLLVQRLGLTIAPLELFALSLIITLAIAMMNWHFVEKPFLRMKPGEGSRVQRFKGSKVAEPTPLP
jgi:peptidoglycan/LPS O-acetylase OafA/YrhL